MILWLATASATCPDLEAPLAKAEAELLEFELDKAQASLESVVDALACSEPIEPDFHRRFWITQGVLWSYQEDARKDVALAASKVRLEKWNETFGPAVADEGSLYQAWQAARVPRRTHLLDLQPLPADGQLWVDGISIEAPFDIESGGHLLQVRDGEGTYFAKRLLLDADQVVRLPARGAATPQVFELQLLPTLPAVRAKLPVSIAPKSPEPVEQPSPRPTREKKKRGHGSRGLLISGLVIGGLGAGGMGAAAYTKQAYRVDGTDSDLLYFANLGSGMGGLGLAGLGTVLVGSSLIVNRW